MKGSLHPAGAASAAQAPPPPAPGESARGCLWPGDVPGLGLFMGLLFLLVRWWRFGAGFFFVLFCGYSLGSSPPPFSFSLADGA